MPKRAQDVIDIDTIYKDGIFCSGNKYSKTYCFKDVNYSIASKEEKVNLFLNYSELLNSLDSSTTTKITINNRKVNIQEFKNHILIPLKGVCKFGDVVVVTVGHRLNILGFLDMSSFGPAYENSVNAGMADIVASLKWVRDNIASFGGDPDNVTVFGQSGGGGKVSTLLQIPEADGLYHRAVMMSGGCDSHDNKTPDHRPLIQEMLRVLGHSPEEHQILTKIPYSALMKTYNRAARNLNMPLLWGPVPNGWYLGHPFQAGFSSYAKKVPTLVSSVLSEFSSFGQKGPTPQDSAGEKVAFLQDYYNQRLRRSSLSLKKPTQGKTSPLPPSWIFGPAPLC